MSKAFTRETDDDDDDEVALPAIPAGTKNYITPEGYRRLKAEYMELLDVERPALVQTVHWAASNGDRSENGDYIYGKKRLREIDRRLRFLAKRLESSEVIDPAQRQGCDQVFFGATVTVCHGDGSERTYSIVGIDEANASKGHISWVSPLARTLLKTRADDAVVLQLPEGVDELVVIEVVYRHIEL
ncbi:MAG: transcription elongation factor GreB [Sideroxydans sp. GWF2_59_14]|nr:MAG: transcription elongation factor GreB [Sideroxydans sp. GWF2_59_14]HAF45189.1 transcription elongation factor GreB [Gallionellaceae bacterium]